MKSLIPEFAFAVYPVPSISPNLQNHHLRRKLKHEPEHSHREKKESKKRHEKYKSRRKAPTVDKGCKLSQMRA